MDPIQNETAVADATEQSHEAVLQAKLDQAEATIRDLREELAAQREQVTFNQGSKTLTIGFLRAKLDLFKAKGVEKARKLVKAACPSLGKADGSPEQGVKQLIEAAGTCLWLAGCFQDDGHGNPVNARKLRGNRTDDVDGNWKAAADYNDDRLV